MILIHKYFSFLQLFSLPLSSCPPFPFSFPFIISPSISFPFSSSRTTFPSHSLNLHILPFSFYSPLLLPFLFLFLPIPSHSFQYLPIPSRSFPFLSHPISLPFLPGEVFHYAVAPPEFDDEFHYEVVWLDNVPPPPKVYIQLHLEYCSHFHHSWRDCFQSILEHWRNYKLEHLMNYRLEY